ncbi:DUF4253 domain-containing protein [Aquabacterium sp. A7-Y]|uniref:DUF4253 domain-containing protein n=1 Tax=Aquabacterium sp. A7-Y TaxID=1349605 RepID=UPI00223D2227|nr:DUF4253 domain-containing protein [Aquabacterium sp. A7-Y]MCW7540902.1 DUF4253 domain-containing protein [Aquabacterium sp. A7-Y]
MKRSSAAVRRLLRGTPLQDSLVRLRWLSAWEEPAYLIKVRVEHADAYWRMLRERAEAVGWYALMMPDDNVDYLFDPGRPPHRREKADRNDPDPLPDPELHQGPMAPRASHDGLLGWLDLPLERDGHVLGKTLRRFGACPSVDEVRALRDNGVLRNDADLERWLLHWECRRFGAAATEPGPVWHMDWGMFDRDKTCTAALLPFPASWHTFAHMGWYGLTEDREEKICAMRRWEARYGARIKYAGNTTLQVDVQRRPETLDEAFDLALEHSAFAWCTLVLPGISLRDHARALFALDHWHFHDRP